ncbi:hypothetical protein SUNI508_01222 [Seiridium unicorne]|uniref:NADH dehydrogenase subunit 6 n=1 Tax=Seiridium unicorne TaxID=138068 RepID=A0ABR2UX29_9PEZI
MIEKVLGSVVALLLILLWIYLISIAFWLGWKAVVHFIKGFFYCAIISIIVLFGIIVTLGAFYVGIQLCT